MSKSDAPTPPRSLHITAVCQSDKGQVLHVEYEDANISKYFLCCEKEIEKKKIQRHQREWQATWMEEGIQVCKGDGMRKFIPKNM